jgi:hypothetical protein
VHRRRRLRQWFQGYEKRQIARRRFQPGDAQQRHDERGDDREGLNGERRPDRPRFSSARLRVDERLFEHSVCPLEVLDSGRVASEPALLCFVKVDAATGSVVPRSTC